MQRALSILQHRKFLFAGGIFLLLIQYTITAGAQVQNTIDTSATLSLQQCVDMAIRNNPTVRQIEFTMESAKVTWQQQKATMLPSVSGYVNYVNNGGRSINNATNQYINTNYYSGYAQLQGSLVLWNGSSIQHFIRQYALNYEASRMDWQQAKDQLTINVILAYLNVLSSQEQLNMAQRQIEATKGKVALLEIQNKEGSIAPSALTDMKGQLASDEMTAVNTRNALETYKLTLAQLMNVPYSPNLKLENASPETPPQLYDATVDQIYQNAMQNLALVKASQLHLASAEKGVSATRGNMAPTLSLVGQVNTNYSSAAATTQNFLTGYDTSQNGINSYVMNNGSRLPLFSPTFSQSSQKISFADQIKNNRNTYFGLALNIPILNGLRLRTLHRQAQIARDQAAFTANTTLVQLRQAIEQDYVNMQSAYRTYSALVSQVENYTESFRAAEIRFSLGAVSALTSLDYLNAKNNIDRARLNMIQAKYNYILQTKVLDYFQGKLTF